VALTRQVVDEFNRPCGQVDLAFSELKLSATGQVDDVAALGADVIIAEAPGLRHTHACTRDFLEDRLRVQRDRFDMRQTIGSRVDALHHERLGRRLRRDHGAILHYPPETESDHEGRAD
jgi:hypothetical protein